MNDETKSPVEFATVSDADRTPSVVTVRIRGTEITHGDAAELLRRASEYVRDPQVGHHGYIKRIDRFDGFGVFDEPRLPAWAEIEIA